jgi:hypothetical protein
MKNERLVFDDPSITIYDNEKSTALKKLFEEVFKKRLNSKSNILLLKSNEASNNES